MNLAVAQEARVFEAGNEAQDASLLAELEMILEADEVVAVGAQILFAQLHDGPGSFAGARIAQANGLHGTEAEGVAAAAGQHFDGQAAFEIVELLPFLGFGGFGGEQRVEKAVELLAVHGAVDVVGSAFVPAGGHVDAIHVDGFGIDDGGDGVVEGEVAGAGEALDLAAEGVGGERAGGEDGALCAVLVLDECIAGNIPRG